MFFAFCELYLLFIISFYILAAENHNSKNGYMVRLLIQSKEVEFVVSNIVICHVPDNLWELYRS